MNRTLPRARLLANASGTALAVVLLVLPALGRATVPVQTAPARRSPWIRRMQIIGRVRSVNHVTLTAPLSGRVWEPTRPAGQVRAGALLARLTPPGLHARVQAARTQLRLAEINVRRNRVLYHDGVVALQTLQASRATAQQMRAQAQSLQEQLADQAIHAPFGGIVTYRVPAGAVVSAGTPIATLDGRGTPWIEAWMAPDAALHLSRTAPVHIRFDEWAANGRIRSIGHSARQSGLVAVYVTPPRHAPLLPGEWVYLRFALRPEPAFEVPLAAVVMQGAHQQVFRVHAGHAVAVPVRVLGTRSGHAWIAGPLHVGEPVIVRGAARVLDGSPVQPRP